MTLLSSLASPVLGSSHKEKTPRRGFSLLLAVKPGRCPTLCAVRLAAVLPVCLFGIGMLYRPGLGVTDEEVVLDVLLPCVGILGNDRAIGVPKDEWRDVKGVTVTQP